MKQRTITVNQEKVLEFCREYVKENDVFPSYREILAQAGLSSTRSVHIVIYALVKKGFLRRTGIKRRPVEFPIKTIVLETNSTVCQGNGEKIFNFIL